MERKTLTAGDHAAALDLIWGALWFYQDESLREQTAANAAAWDDLCLAMAWLTEAAGWAADFETEGNAQ